jgi:hypothetical protein
LARGGYQTGFRDEEMRDFFPSLAWIGAFDRLEDYFRLNAHFETRPPFGVNWRG